MFGSKSYKEYIKSNTSYSGIQDYDILYFDSTKNYDHSIMKDINNGAVLFARGLDDGSINGNHKI